MIYLDNAATSFPKPEPVISAMTDCLRHYCGNPGRSGHRLSIKTAEKLFETRLSLAELFHFSDPLKIIFTGNTTEALNLAIKGLLKPGDHVVTTSMEHNSVLRPLMGRPDLSLTILQGDPEGRIQPRQFSAAVRDNTKMFICTHSSNVTGTLAPIQAIGSIAREKGILFLVDAAQSAGIVPIDFRHLPVDLMAFAGHKSLQGPQGTGFLYVNGQLPLRPLKEGGTGTESKNTRQPLSFPEGYEAGTLNSPGIIGLGAGIKFLLETGLSAAAQKEAWLSGLLEDGLRNIEGVRVYGPSGMKGKTPVVSCRIQGKEGEEVAALLNDHFQVAVRAGFHCAPLAHETIGTGKTGTIRFSPGLFTKKLHIQRTLYAMNRIAAGKLK